MMEERWFDEELAGCRLGDGRLDRRLRQLVERMEVGFGESSPLASQHWADTKAAYRFFSNDRVSEEDILRGHFDATGRRFAASHGPILVLHDTTEFTWKRRRPGAVGFTTMVNSGKDKAGRREHRGVAEDSHTTRRDAGAAWDSARRILAMAAEWRRIVECRDELARLAGKGQHRGLDVLQPGQHGLGRNTRRRPQVGAHRAHWQMKREIGMPAASARSRLRRHSVAVAVRVLGYHMVSVASSMVGSIAMRNCRIATKCDPAYP